MIMILISISNLEDVNFTHGDEKYLLFKLDIIFIICEEDYTRTTNNHDYRNPYLENLRNHIYRYYKYMILQLLIK